MSRFLLLLGLSSCSMYIPLLGSSCDTLNMDIEGYQRRCGAEVFPVYDCDSKLYSEGTTGSCSDDLATWSCDTETLPDSCKLHWFNP